MRKLLLLIIVFVLLLIFWRYETGEVDSNNKSQINIEVKSGEGVKEVAENLLSNHLIKNVYFFEIVARFAGLGSKLQAGNFSLSPSMNDNTIIANLEKNPADLWITIPEGKRADEIAEILSHKMVNYNDNWKQLLEENEGYLFPDTYLLNKNASIQTVIAEFRNNFDTKYNSLTFNTNLTKEQVVILASLIEREGRSDSDRPLIASVFMNRLKLGMPLQVDSTIQYALGYDSDSQTWWKSNLTADDLKIVSPYNTYINTGLPPGPICNPGVKALQAAASPAQSDYLFYVADKNGVTHFAKTLNQQNENIKKYGI